MSSSVQLGISSILGRVNTRDLLLYWHRISFQRGATSRRWQSEMSRLGVVNPGLEEVNTAWTNLLSDMAAEILKRHIALELRLPISETLEAKMLSMLTPTEEASIQAQAKTATTTQIREWARGVIQEDEVATVLGKRVPDQPEQDAIDVWEDDEVASEDEEADTSGEEVELDQDSDDSS